MLAAQHDLYGAREALIRFDEIANPERTIGRFVLFDVLVQTGDGAGALSRAASWIAHFRKAGLHRGSAGAAAYERLLRMMLAVDEAETRRLLCDLSALGKPERGADISCDTAVSGMQSEPEGTTITHATSRDSFTRRKRQ
jgi:hypothetical protein